MAKKSNEIQIISPAKLGIILSKFSTFKNPKLMEEQYQTPSEIAAQVIHHAAMLGDIAGKKIVDFGAGNGILGLGAAILGAKEVILVENDNEAAEICEKNARIAHIYLRSEQIITVKCQNVIDFEGKSETLIMNPPFGTKIKHADREFLIKAFEVSPVIYKFAKAVTESFIERISADNKYKITHKWDFPTFMLKKSHKMHKKPRKSINVVCFRLIKEF